MAAAFEFQRGFVPEPYGMAALATTDNKLSELVLSTAVTA